MEYKGFDIRIEQEEYTENPRECWDHFGHLITWERGRPAGDDDQKMTIPEWNKYEAANYREIAYLPVYILDHSGRTIRTYPFNDPWDSGLWGFIYVTHDDIRKNWNVKRVTKALKEKAKKLLQSEVEEYDFYLRGDVWYYTVSKDGETIDSLGAIFDYNEAEKEAEQFVDRWLECQ